MEFCVYEHWRPDTGCCFYVGKGKLRRAHAFGQSAHRSSHHRRVVEKLKRLGLKVDVRIVATGLDEAAAFCLERERIAHWRCVRVPIVNKSDGGDGSSGYRFTDAQKNKIRRKAKLRKASPETRAKMSAAHTGRRQSEATKQKVRAAALAVQGAARRAYCKTPAGKMLMLRMAQKAAADPEVRRKRSENAKALWADPAYRANVMAARGRS